MEVKSADVLHAIQPNLEFILHWGRANQVNGCYVYCKLAPNRYVGRNFNHANPKLEDAATGVAAGALSAYLKQNIELHQGDIMHNPCLMRTIYSSEHILIGGAAVAVES